MRRLIPICTIVITLFNAVVHANWPEWRGPTANVVAPAGDYPVEFSSTKNMLWQVDLAGEGSSTPIVWDEMIYVTLTADEKDVLAAYDLDGDEQWRRVLGAARPGKHANATGSNSSPVTNGKQVVAYFKSGLVVCFDIAGEELWRLNLQDEYGKDTLWWDLGTSPVITTAGVCIAVIQEGNSYLVMLDLNTGDVVWKHPRNYKRPTESDQAYTTPTVAQIDGKETIITWGADYLTGHDAKSGQPLWECGGFNPKNEGMWRVIASATVADGLAIVQYGRGEFVAAVRVGGSGDITTENRVWEKRGIGADVPSPIVAEGKAYILGDKGEVTCLNVQSGDILWQDRLPRGSAKYYSSPLLAGDKLYCLRDDGTMFVASVDGGLQLLGENDLGDRTVATPVPIDGTLLVRTRTKLFRFGSLEVKLPDSFDSHVD
ncbi:MAG: PQQ-binding-like beta-propeller repeat protein [Aeoliella sp.]